MLCGMNSAGRSENRRDHGREATKLHDADNNEHAEMSILARHFRGETVAIFLRIPGLPAALAVNSDIHLSNSLIAQLSFRARSLKNGIYIWTSKQVEPNLFIEVQVIRHRKRGA